MQAIRRKNRLMTGKAQVQSQMFIYILSIIIIGMLLFLGIKWIAELKNTGDVIDVTRFRIDLENSFDTIRPQYGSADNYEYTVPSGIDIVCFVNTRYDNIGMTELCTPGNVNYSAIICNSWKDNTSSVLFSPPVEDINVGPIDMSGPYICFHTTTNRKIELRLVGLGDRVRILRID